MSWKRPPPPLAAQRLRLAALALPGANFSGSGPRRLRYEFDAVPLVGAQEYRCRIEMQPDSRRVHTFVLEPDLQLLAPDWRLPHIYEHERGVTRLCLYTPKNGEWRPGSWLSETIVPWTFEWLRYFELWLIDGVWHGGGTHPDAPRRRYGVRRSKQ